MPIENEVAAGGGVRLAHVGEDNGLSHDVAREWPGPQASSRVTLAPRSSSASAVHAPNAPLPTTTTSGSRVTMAGAA